MSIFRNLMVQCPVCSTPIDFELVISVAADRRPDLREQILDGSFQRQPCPACLTPFRVEPEFAYIDFARRQYLGVWPKQKRAEWQSCAQKTREVFDDALGERATPEARRLGGGLDVRVVFGWPALAEKLIARDAGVDDRTLEVAKLAAMRSADDCAVPGGGTELRLVGREGDDLVLAWIGSGDDMPPLWRLPRGVLAEIDADPVAWQAARAAVGEGDVVDFQRDLLAA